MVPSLEAPPPPFQLSDCSFRRELEHGPPLHFFSDPRAEDQDIETHPSPDEETVVGTPTPSWIEGADGEKQEVIFVVFDEIDPRDPFQFSNRRKWVITLVASTYTIMVSWALSCYSISISNLREDMGYSAIQAAAGISVYAWGFGIAPMFLAPMAEEFGRNALYLGSAFIFTLFIIPVACAQNLETIIVARFLMGVAGSTGSTMVGGTMADIWRTHERGLPMSIFAAAALAGIAIGAMSNGYLADREGWRIVQWLFFALMGSFLPVMWFALLETRGAVILTRIATQKRKETGDNRYRSHAELERPPMLELIKISAVRPFWFLLTEPVVSAFSLWIGILWGTLYGCLESFPFVLQRLHGFTNGEVGLAYCTFLIGTVAAFFANMYQDKLYIRYYPRIGPEARLFAACAAGIIVPVGCFIYAWTSYETVHWIAPCIGMTVMIFGIFQVYLSVFNYLSDSYLIYASSALAAQSFSRNAFAGAFPLFIDTMYEKLNPRWSGTIFGGVAAVLAVIPFILIFKGPQIRAASKVAQTLIEVEKK